MSVFDFLSEFMKTGNNCIYCGRELKDGAEICAGCLSEELKLRNRRSTTTGSLRRGPGDDILFAYKYDGVIRRLLHKYKYEDMPRFAPFMARRMEEYLSEAGVLLPPSIVTFVPVHKSRLQQRGFDQSELLATHLALRLEMPSERLLERIRHTAPQYDLNAEQRSGNVAGAFRYVGSRDIRGAHILLIDDIYTTGATVSECMKQLKGAHIQVMAFARDF